MTLDGKDVKASGADDKSVAARVAACPGYARLTQAVGQLEDQGYHVAFVVHDLGSGRELTYNQDELFYPASSIKGPYVTCLYQSLAETGKVSLDELAPLAKRTVVNSDNEAYKSLRNRYGGDEFAAWLEELGCGTGELPSYQRLGSKHYPHLSAAMLAQMWQKSYGYLSGGSKAATQLSGYFASRTQTALGDALGETYPTWGKAGWYPTRAGHGALPSTVDAGVALAPHPYVVVVMSDAPGALPLIEPVFGPLDEVHGQMEEA